MDNRRVLEGWHMDGALAINNNIKIHGSMMRLDNMFQKILEIFFVLWILLIITIKKNLLM
jgi:hypothetical protein